MPVVSRQAVALQHLAAERLAEPSQHLTGSGAPPDTHASVYGGRIRAQPELVDDVLAHPRGPVSVRGYRYQLLAGVGWTSLPLLPLLRQPILVLVGDHDPIIPLANAYLMTRLLPRSRLHVYHDGHPGLATSADELAPLVARFLREDTHADRDRVRQPS